MAYQFYDAEVTRILDVTPTVKRYLLKVKNVPNFNFKPGQFVMLDLPIDAKRTTRSYSIASPPLHNNEFELIIVLKEDGAGTPYLFDTAKVKPGTLLKTSKALGSFTLNNPLPKEVCFICTGTGVAPFRSMLLDLDRRGLLNIKINLIFGCRYCPDMLYKDDFDRLATEYPNFNYYPVLSREKDLPENAESGYVHKVYKKLYADHHPATFYICGWRNMIMEARDNLKAMGYDRTQVKFELYD